MKMRELIKLAENNDRVLVKFAKIWDEIQNGKDAGKGKDPVSLALEWKKTISKYAIRISISSFLCTAFILPLFFKSKVAQHSQETQETTVLFMVLFALAAGCTYFYFLFNFLIVFKHFYFKPIQTKMFIEIISSLERLPASLEACPNQKTVGLLNAKNLAWSIDGVVSKAAHIDLVRFASEIEKLELRLDIPWRKEETKTKVTQMRDQFRLVHSAYRALFSDLPEDWSNYFIQTGSKPLPK